MQKKRNDRWMREGKVDYRCTDDPREKNALIESGTTRQYWTLRHLVTKAFVVADGWMDDH